MVYAQTDPSQGPRGIAAFLVRADQPGVVREKAQRSGHNPFVFLTPFSSRGLKRS